MTKIKKSKYNSISLNSKSNINNKSHNAIDIEINDPNDNINTNNILIENNNNEGIKRLSTESKMKEDNEERKKIMEKLLKIKENKCSLYPKLLPTKSTFNQIDIKRYKDYISMTHPDMNSDKNLNRSQSQDSQSPSHDCSLMLTKLRTSKSNEKFNLKMKGNQKNIELNNNTNNNYFLTEKNDESLRIKSSKKILADLNDEKEKLEGYRVPIQIERKSQRKPRSPKYKPGIESYQMDYKLSRKVNPLFYKRIDDLENERFKKFMKRRNQKLRAIELLKSANINNKDMRIEKLKDMLKVKNSPTYNQKNEK